MDTKLTPIQSTPYLTIIPGRYRARQKTHRTLGHAKNAVLARYSWGPGLPEDVAIYEWRDGEWGLLWEIPKGTKENDLPWRKDK